MKTFKHTKKAKEIGIELDILVIIMLKPNCPRCCSNSKVSVKTHR